MPNEFVARNGIIALKDSQLSGSLLGTASYATQALSASWAPAGASNPFPFTGSAAITGSLTLTGSLAIDGAILSNLKTVTGSYTLVLADAGKTLEISGSTDTEYSITIPANSTSSFAVGTNIDVLLYGTGSIRFVSGSGVTIRSANNWTKMGTRYGAASLLKRGTDEWYLIGNINP